MQRRTRAPPATSASADDFQSMASGSNAYQRSGPARISSTSANSTCSANQTVRLRITPTTAAVMAASAPDRRRLARSCSTNGAPAKISSIGGTKVTQVVSAEPSTALVSGENGSGSAPGAEEADELRHLDQRAGQRLGEAQPVDHLRRAHPAVGLHRLLRHVGEQRIGAAEAHHRELGEEQADVDEHVLRAERSARPAPPAPTTARARPPRRAPPAASARDAVR